MSLDIYIRVPPMDDSAGVCPKVYLGMSKFVVTGLFGDSLLSKIHIMCPLLLSAN